MTKNKLFIAHFIASAAILVLANTWFVLANHNIPDGRALFEVPITGAVMLLCATLLGALGVSLFHQVRPYMMTVSAGLTSVLFVGFANRIQMALDASTSFMFMRFEFVLPLYAVALVSMVAVYLVLMSLSGKRSNVVNSVA